MNRAYLIVIIFFILISCKASRNVAVNKLKSYSASELDAKIRENKFEFNTFSAKARLNIAGPGINQGVAAQFDIIPDSIIGISLRLLGIEGARILITPDSIKLLDRINQKYIAKDFSYIQAEFDIDADFLTIQSLLAGNPVFYDQTIKSIGAGGDKYVLFASDSVYKNTIWISPGFSLMRMFIQDLSAERSIALTYQDYNKIDGQQFAFIRNIFIDAHDDFSAEIEFTNVTIDEPVEFAFSVNSKYTKVE